MLRQLFAVQKAFDKVKGGQSLGFNHLFTLNLPQGKYIIENAKRFLFVRTS
jgi:hypothetical protein